MSWVPGFAAAAGGLLLMLSIPAAATAQVRALDLASIATSAAAGADWASTYRGLKHFNVREANPILQPLQKSPGILVTVGAAIDAGGLTAWNLTVGRKHPRVAVTGLWAMTAFRTYIAIRNLQTQKKFGRRIKAAPDKPPGP